MEARICALPVLVAALALVAPIRNCEAGLEDRALRQASGLYGKKPGVLIPTGIFNGRIGNLYAKEHSSVLLRCRKGARKSILRLVVWDGVSHVTRFVAVTATVRSGGRVVAIKGGRVAGTGLLPLGVRVRSGRVDGAVRLGAGAPSLSSKFTLAGNDLAKGGARVRGTGRFSGRKGG